jgi:hypothetical protein
LGTWGFVSLLGSQIFGIEGHTEIFDEDLFSGHDFWLLGDNCSAVFQKLLLLRLVQPEPIGIPSSCPLRQIVFDILDGSFICNLDAGRESLN